MTDISTAAASLLQEGEEQANFFKALWQIQIDYKPYTVIDELCHVMQGHQKDHNGAYPAKQAAISPKFKSLVYAVFNMMKLKPDLTPEAHPERWTGTERETSRGELFKIAWTSSCHLTKYGFDAYWKPLTNSGFLDKHNPFDEKNKTRGIVIRPNPKRIRELLEEATARKIKDGRRKKSIKYKVSYEVQKKSKKKSATRCDIETYDAMVHYPVDRVKTTASEAAIQDGGPAKVSFKYKEPDSDCSEQDSPRAVTGNVNRGCLGNEKGTLGPAAPEVPSIFSSGSEEKPNIPNPAVLPVAVASLSEVPVRFPSVPEILPPTLAEKNKLEVAEVMFALSAAFPDKALDDKQFRVLKFLIHHPLQKHRLALQDAKEYAWFMSLGENHPYASVTFDFFLTNWSKIKVVVYARKHMKRISHAQDFLSFDFKKDIQSSVDHVCQMFHRELSKNPGRDQLDLLASVCEPYKAAEYASVLEDKDNGVSIETVLSRMTKELQQEFSYAWTEQRGTDPWAALLEICRPKATLTVMLAAQQLGFNMDEVVPILREDLRKWAKAHPVPFFKYAEFAPVGEWAALSDRETRMQMTEARFRLKALQHNNMLGQVYPIACFQ